MHALVLSIVVQAAFVSQAAERSMLSDVNAIRAQAGLPALRLDPKLCDVALEHDLDMVRRHYFDHRSPDGRSPFDRMRQALLRFMWAAENIALGPGERSAFEAFLQSPQHLQNILGTHFHRIGIAAVRDEDGEWMFVQDFTD